MSTRGAVGFYLDGKEFVTYNHSDSYPSWLMKSLIDQFKGLRIDNANLTEERDFFQLMRHNVADIILVDETLTPTLEDAAELLSYSDFSVSRKSIDDWYCLLRDQQGDVSNYLSGNLKAMIDSVEFLKDSLFCEWAYIFNFDTMRFEIYKGFNDSPDGAGRYAGFKEEEDSEYYGVKLVKEIAFSDLLRLTDYEPLIKELEGEDVE